MAVNLNAKFVQLPTSTAVDQPVKSQAHHVYWAQTMGRNANYLAASRALIVIGCGHHSADDGAAAPTTDTWAVNSGVNYGLVRWGQSILWPRPIGAPATIEIEYRAKVAHVSSPTAASIQVFLSPVPCPGNYTKVSARTASTITVAPSSTSIHEVAGSTSYVVPPTGMIYWYIAMREVQRAMGFILFARPPTS